MRAGFCRAMTLWWVARTRVIYGSYGELERSFCS